jgi:isocitrate dehydrogenase
MYNTDDSIRNFARICFDYSLNHNLPLRMAAKQSFLKQYDARYRHIFDDTFDEYSQDFADKLIDYEHRNIDDLIS